MNDASSSSSVPSRPLRSPGAERARRARRRAGIAAAILAGLAVLYAGLQAWLHYDEYRVRDAESDLLRSAITYVIVAVLYAIAAAVVWRGQMWMLITTSATCGVAFVLIVVFGVRQGESPLYLLPWLVLTPAVLMLAWLPWFFSSTNEL